MHSLPADELSGKTTTVVLISTYAEHLRDKVGKTVSTEVELNTTQYSNCCYIVVNHSSRKINILNSDKPLPKVVLHSNYTLIAEITAASNNTFNLRRATITRPAAILKSKGKIATTTFVKLTGEGPLEEYRLRNNDMIKFGDEIYKVLIPNKTFQTDKGKEIEPESSLEAVEQIYSQERISVGCCRICLMQEGSDTEDCLITPCKCTGSCIVHLFCLRKWMKSRISLFENDKTRTYNLSKFYCQLCKEKLPHWIQLESKLLSLFPQNLFEDAQLVLHMLPSKQFEYLHCIHFDFDRTVLIGRSSINDVSLRSTSASREHATIEYRFGKIYLKDQQSKFGTFVPFRENIKETVEATLCHDGIICHIKVKTEDTKLSILSQ